MTFEDMMKMKRLGDTAVSPDGKWLAYSVTTVDLDQNTKTAELWTQAIAGSNSESQAPQRIAVAHPGDSGLQFAPDGKRILFLSGRTGAQQIWLADFDAATGETAHPRKISNLDLGIDNAIWSPDAKSIVFTAPVYPDCPAIEPNDTGKGAECNYDRDAALADSKVKAQIFTHLLYRHWNRYTGDKRSHVFILSVENGGIRDLTPNDPHDVPPFSLEGGGCGCAFAPDSRELAFTENLDPEPAASVSAKIFTLDLTNPAAKPVMVSMSLGGNFNPAYSPDGKYLAWRSQARAGYESDKFRLVLYDRAMKTVKDLLPKFENWVDEFVWGPDSKVIYLTAGNQGEASVFSYEFGSAVANLGNRLNQYTASGEFSGLHITFDGNRLVATRQRIDAPGEAVLFYQLNQLVAFAQSCDPVVGAKSVHCPPVLSPSPTSTTRFWPNST